MRTDFYLNGNKMAKKDLFTIFGKDNLRDMIAIAKDDFWADPLATLDYSTNKGTLRIQFYG